MDMLLRSLSLLKCYDTFCWADLLKDLNIAFAMAAKTSWVYAHASVYLIMYACLVQSFL